MELLLIAAGTLVLIVSSNIASSKKRGSHWLTTVWMFINLATFLCGALLLLSSLLPLSPFFSHSPPTLPGIILMMASLMSSLLLFSAVRKRLSRWIDIDVSSTVHLTALSLSLYLLAWSLLNVAWMGGIEGLREEAETVSVVMLLLQSAVLVLVAFLGVGMGTRRSMREVVERLGLHRLEWVHLLIAGVTLVIMVVLNFVVAGLWMLLAPEQVEAISQISQSMLGNFDSVPAIILLAVLSGFSEEVLFRGALQPRMGLFLTSLLFAGTHVQYSISPATLLVLVIGIVLGILRRFFGTWTSIITHFGYNLSLLLLGMLGSRLLEVLG